MSATHKLEKIYQYIEVNPGCTRGDVSRALGLVRTNIEGQLATMEILGLHLSEDDEGGLYAYGCFLMGELLDIPGMARELGLNDKYVGRLCREGDIPAFKIGRRWYIERSCLEAWDIDRELWGSAKAPQ